MTSHRSHSPPHRSGGPTCCSSRNSSNASALAESSLFDAGRFPEVNIQMSAGQAPRRPALYLECRRQPRALQARCLLTGGGYYGALRFSTTRAWPPVPVSLPVPISYLGLRASVSTLVTPDARFLCVLHGIFRRPNLPKPKRRGYCPVIFLDLDSLGFGSKGHGISQIPSKVHWRAQLCI